MIKVTIEKNTAQKCNNSYRKVQELNLYHIAMSQLQFIFEGHVQNMLICKNILWNSAENLQSVLYHLLKDKHIRKHVSDMSVNFSLNGEGDVEWKV